MRDPLVDQIGHDLAGAGEATRAVDEVDEALEPAEHRLAAAATAPLGQRGPARRVATYV